jgi:hypothetical protein
VGLITIGGRTHTTRLYRDTCDSLSDTIVLKFFWPVQRPTSILLLPRIVWKCPQNTGSLLPEHTVCLHNHTSRTAGQMVPAFFRNFASRVRSYGCFSSYGMLTYYFFNLIFFNRTTPVTLSSFVGLMFGILLMCASFTFYLYEIVYKPSQ